MPLERSAADRLFDWRGAERRTVALEHVGRPALRPSHLIANTIEERLPKVRLERAVVARLEGTETLHDVRERVLHEVVGVERSPGPGRQTAVRPFLKPRQIAGTEGVQGLSVPTPRPREQVHRCCRTRC